MVNLFFELLHSTYNEILAFKYQFDELYIYNYKFFVQ